MQLAGTLCQSASQPLAHLGLYSPDGVHVPLKMFLATAALHVGQNG